MTRRCWTCNEVVEDYVALSCARPHCTGRHDAQRDAKKAYTSPPNTPVSSPYYVIDKPVDLTGGL
jgi:hypothetical protein